MDYSGRLDNVKIMGKCNIVDTRTLHETENNRSMSDKMSVNEKPIPRWKKHLKMSKKGTMLKTIKGFNAKVQRGDGVRRTSPSKRPDESQTETRKKRYRPKMGSPIIVEDTVGECPKTRIPATLRHAADEKSTGSVSYSLGPFVLARRKNRDGKADKAKITVAECIDPSITDFSSKSDDVWTVVKKRSKKRVEPMEEEEVEQVLSKNVASKENLAIENEAALSCPADNLQETETKQLPRFYSLRNKVLAIVEPDCSFCFHGKLLIRVLYGAVRIYGAHFARGKMHAPIAVYSPRAYSPIAIEALESEIDDRSIRDLWESLTRQCADRKFAKRLQLDIENLDDGWAVVELENFENQLTSFLATHCPYHLFPKVEDPSNHSWRDARRAEIVLQANLRFVDSCKQLTIGSRGIDDIADGICYDWDAKAVSRTIFAGGKGVGKSTTARYLINKLLAKSKAVLVLDLDPGQAEFTPAGCISLNIVEEPLLGPNFTHLATPYHQLYVGSADVTRCFAHYVEGVKRLVNRMHDDPRLVRLPLVVNTMGFCKGIGWDIIAYVVKLVTPTDVVQILSKRAKNNFDDTLSRQAIDRQSRGSMTWMKDTTNWEKPAKHRLHVIYSEAETGAGIAESWNLEAHQQRDLVFLAYLSQTVYNDADSFAVSQRAPTLSINAVTPYAVPFSAVSVSLAGAFIPQVLSVMNGNIVALCGVDSELESTEESNVTEDLAASYPRVLIRPPLSTCYGFGILRGVDMEKEQLFLNTPLCADVMQHVNCLIGCVNLPLSLLQLSQQGAPYTGSEYDLPTSRGSRRGYYRMRYQADT